MSTTGGTRLPHFRKALDHDGHDSDPSPRLRNHDRGQRGETFTDTTPSLVAGWFAHDQGTTFFPISPRVQKPCHPSPRLQPANPQLPQVVARSQTSTVLMKRNRLGAALDRTSAWGTTSLVYLIHLPQQQCSSCQHRAVAICFYTLPSHSPLSHVTCPCHLPYASPVINHLSPGRPQQPTAYSISSNGHVLPPAGARGGTGLPTYILAGLGTPLAGHPSGSFPVFIVY